MFPNYPILDVSLFCTSSCQAFILLYCLVQLRSFLLSLPSLNFYGVNSYVYRIQYLVLTHLFISVTFILFIVVSVYLSISVTFIPTNPKITNRTGHLNHLYISTEYGVVLSGK